MDDEKETTPDSEPNSDEKQDGKDEGEDEKFDLEPEVKEKTGKDEKKAAKEEEDETFPEDAELITKVAGKRIEPLERKLDHITTVNEVDTFIAKRPEYAKYRDIIIRHTEHPDYKNIPISFIAAGITARDQQKIGAEKEREAQRKADETKGAGTSYRPESQGTVDWGKVSKEDFEKKKAEVLGRR